MEIHSAVCEMKRAVWMTEKTSSLWLHFTNCVYKKRKINNLWIYIYIYIYTVYIVLNTVVDVAKLVELCDAHQR